MNCLLEGVAGFYLFMRGKVMAPPLEEEIYSAQDSLEDCRKTMRNRERELVEEIAKLSESALRFKQLKDMASARSKLAERKRAHKRLDKLRNGMHLVDSQLDAIKTSELDKEIMLSLKASTTAMKKAGVGVGAQDAEQVIGELDEHIREMQDVTTVLANPIGMEDDVDLEEELNLLGEEHYPLQKIFTIQEEPGAPPVTTDVMEKKPLLAECAS